MPSAHYLRVKRHADKKAAILRAYKEAMGCQSCGEDDPDCLDMHHRDPETKNPKLVGHGRRKNWQYNLNLTELAEEIEKCDVLCANCHRKEEARLRRLQV